MKKILVIGALLGVMFLLDSLRVEGHGATNPMTLAAIGFVVLAAFATAELGSALSLPRVTGYILAGAALGPSLGNILSGPVVTEMSMFNTLALGLIATSAGLELDVRQLVRLGKTLTATIIVKVVLGVGVVGGTLVAVAGVFDLGLPDSADGGSSFVIALALILGVLSIGTSPSIALAVLNETKAKGRLSDLVLGAAVFKDFVVVVCLAIAIAIARTMMVPGAELDASLLVKVAEELGGSILAGAVLGGILIAYIRFVKAEMLLFVAAMILVVAELCHAFHLELLLVFITAGFVVRNLSKYEHDLVKPLELVALPVFVVFFTNAGAGIDLDSTWKILPVALALCAARAVVYYFAAKFGSRVGNESPSVANNAWYAYLPQAGVTLGLVGLAAQQLPAIGSAIATTGMAVVAINLLIGPVTLRKALQAAHEIPDESGSAVAVAQPPQGPSLLPVPGVKSSSAPPGDSRESERLDGKTREVFDEILLETRAAVDRFRATTLEALPALPSTDTDPKLEDFEKFVGAHCNAARALFEELVASLASLPVSMSARLDTTYLNSVAGDEWMLRVRLWQSRLRHRFLPGGGRRLVLVRLGARMTLERGFAELAHALYELRVYQHLSRRAPRDGSAPGERGAGTPGSRVRDNDMTEQLQTQLNERVESTFEDFAGLLNRMGTPRCPSSDLRFSSVEPTIRKAVEPLEEGHEDFWARRVQAVWGSALARRHVAELDQRVSEALESCIIQPTELVANKVGPALNVLREQLLALEASCRADQIGSPTEALSRWRSDLDGRLTRALDDISREMRASAAVRALTLELKEAMGTLPAHVRCLQLVRGQSPADGSIRSVELRALAERYLIRGLVQNVDQAARNASNAFAQLPRRTKDALERSWSTLEAVGEHRSREAFQARAADELALAAHRLELLERRVALQVNDSIEMIRNSFRRSVDSLNDQIELLGSDAATRRRFLERSLEAARARVLRVAEWLRRHGPRTARLKDATELREAIDRWHGERIPNATARWFSQAPVRDERLFTAQREILDAIVDEEVKWSGGTKTAVLLRGGIGAGKSSLLNMSELELRNPRVLRLDAEGAEQAGGLIDSLALALGTSSEDAALTRQLSFQKPAVLVDNLETWIARAADRTKTLNRLLSLITQTRSTVFWVVVIEEGALQVFEELSDVSEAFPRALTCRPLTATDLAELFEARRLRAGVTLGFRRTFVGGVLSRLGIAGEGELFFRTLTNASHGNPGRALAECARAASMRDGELTLGTRVLRDGHTRIAQSLTTAQLAVLQTILQHGFSDPLQLRNVLGLPIDHLERHLSFLLGAGLLSLGGEGNVYELPDVARWAVILELQRLGALS